MLVREGLLSLRDRQGDLLQAPIEFLSMTDDLLNEPDVATISRTQCERPSVEYHLDPTRL